MGEIRVYGGLPAPRSRRTHDIILDPAVPHGQPGHVNIKLHALTRKMVSGLAPRLTDLLEIASYVYAADQIARRDTLMQPRFGAEWRRTFRFHVAVRDVAFWARRDVQMQLGSMLQFLSDDTFNFSFVPLKPRPWSQAYLEYNAVGPSSGFQPDEIILFSGGLDSFAGALDSAIGNNKRIALVSHQASPMVAKFQRQLVGALRDRVGPDRVLHLSVEVTKGSAKAIEFTQRPRSFLFAVLGFLVAHLFERQAISFYENGIVSMNLPLASHVVGTRATRTTHPRVLHDFGELFTLVAERDVQVRNPFFWKTKADVVRRIADLGWGRWIPSTFSCAAVREATRQNGRHCGVCSQCLDRRFGVLAADCGRFEGPEIYDVDLFTGEREPGAETIMAEVYVLSAFQHAQSSGLAFVSDYVEILRAAPYLGNLPISEVVSRLHEMHQRHGRAVTEVVELAMSTTNSSLTAQLTLPDSSLLAMITGSKAQDIVCRDSVEREPSAVTQAAERPLPILQRPITFSVAQDRRTAVFAGVVTLHGRGVELIALLLPNFGLGIYMKVEAAAAALGTTDGTLRTLISRMREDLSSKFLEAGGGELAIDDIIQNHRWHGYRLNPALAHVPQALGDEPSLQAAE